MYYRSDVTDRRRALVYPQTVYEIWIFRDLIKSTRNVDQAPLANAVEAISLATLLLIDYIFDPQGAIHASPENDYVAFLLNYEPPTTLMSDPGRRLTPLPEYSRLLCYVKPTTRVGKPPFTRLFPEI